MNDSNTDPKTRDQPPNKQSELWWQIKDQPVPLASEKQVLGVLLGRGAKERCMICKQPPHRLRQIQRAVKDAPGLTLYQALSLRRHHIMLQNPGKRPVHLGLGPEDAIRESAEIFERVIEDCLVDQNVSFLNEAQQKENEDRAILLTPDFLFPESVQLRLYHVSKNGDRHPQKGKTIHWLEAKMFYGASSIPHGTPNAVGTILAKMERYVEAFGPGAIVFMQGYGDQLAKDLEAIGVTVLSGSPIPRKMIQRVWDHQMTWCANSDGRILP
jgi:hypothetical protein